ncbi:hypothetical protein JCM10207_005122 [Rhodosporidiobolus poonsookiae]
MAFLFRGYIRLLQRYTLPTQIATASVASASGDLIYQKGFEGKSWAQVEWWKTRRLVIYGGLIHAPISNRWHWVLNKINFERKIKTVLARTATDLTFFSPFSTCLFYTTQGYFEDRPLLPSPAPSPSPSPSSPLAPAKLSTYERLEDRLWPTVQKQWALFGPANLVNLSVVPVYARPPFMNVVSIAWNTFLASSAASSHAAASAPAGAAITERDIAVDAVQAMD